MLEVQTVFQLFAFLPECDLPRVPYRHALMLIRWMEANESNNMCGGGSLFTFHCSFLSTGCVFALWVSVNIWTSVCVIVFTVSPSVYICTKFYFASLIRNSIVYCFYSVWIQMYKEICFFKGWITALVDDDAGTNLSSRQVYFPHVWFDKDVWFGRRQISYTWAGGVKVVGNNVTIELYNNPR